MSAPKIITNYWAKTIPDRQFDWSAWRDGDEPRAAPGPDGAWGKLSVKLTAGLTRINPGALCGQVAGAWRSRNLDSGCRARVGLAPPLFPPHAQPTRPF